MSKKPHPRELREGEARVHFSNPEFKCTICHDPIKDGDIILQTLGESMCPYCRIRVQSLITDLKMERVLVNNAAIK